MCVGNLTVLGGRGGERRKSYWMNASLESKTIRDPVSLNSKHVKFKNTHQY